MKFAAGIDGGGTRTTVRCESLDGGLLAMRTFGPFNINSIGKANLASLLGEIAVFLKGIGTCEALCIGAAGYSNPELKCLVETAMAHAGITRWKLVGDHEIALRGALGDRPGCILVAGTGSVCCGLGSSGSIVRVGGWGHLIGDEGSGYALGREAITAVVQQIDGYGENTVLKEFLDKRLGLSSREDIIRYVYGGDKHRVAAIAPLVEDAAAQEDAKAMQILHDQAERLAWMVRAVVQQTGLKEGELALMGGGLEQGILYRREAVAAIEKSLPGICCIAPRQTAAEGAVRMAEELLEEKGFIECKKESDTAEVLKNQTCDTALRNQKQPVEQSERKKKEYAKYHSRVACAGARLGVDIGGTSIKFAVWQDGDILYRNKIRTARNCEAILQDITEEGRRLKESYNVASVGVGTAGSVRDGLVSASNLPFENVPLERLLREQLRLPVRVENDANCAVLGEMAFGAVKDCENLVLITIGTGIGGGIILNGCLCRGRGSMGDIGHMTVQRQDGLECPCGKHGCWEQYASSSALARQAEKAAREHPESVLYEFYRKNGWSLEGKTVFEALELGCGTAETVFDRYIGELAVGIENLYRILEPDVFVLAGAVTAQGEKLLLPLRKKLSSGIRVEISMLQGDAGVLGAAIL